MIKEYGVHRFTNIIIAAKRERKITDSPTDMGTGKIPFNPSGSFDKIYRVIIVLFNPCSYGKHVGVKDNIVRIKPHFIY